MADTAEKDRKSEETRQAYLEKAYSYKDRFVTQLADHDFIIYPDVFNPDVFPSTRKIVHHWIELVQAIKPNSLLEIGAGAGYLAILAALHGANNVTATDINSDAIANMQENVDRYNLKDRFRVLFGSIFEPLTENDKFDVVFWSIPFGVTDKPLDELDMIEKSLVDPGYKQIGAYIKDAHKYLNENGRVFISFSKVLGNFETLSEIVRNSGCDVKIYQGSDASASTSSKTSGPVDVDLYEIFKK